MAQPVDEARERFVHERLTTYVRPMDKSTQTQLEAAVFRRLVEHLRNRSDVQNIDLMNLAGFCRNCLSNWLEDEARNQGVEMTREGARQHVYGMPYEDWKAKYQQAATPAQPTTSKSAKPHSH